MQHPNWPRWFGIALLIAGLLPYLAAQVARQFADHVAHCPANAGEIQPCWWQGHDWGAAVYHGLQYFWLSMLSLWLVPFGIASLLFASVEQRRKGANA